VKTMFCKRLTKVKVKNGIIPGGKGGAKSESESYEALNHGGLAYSIPLKGSWLKKRGKTAAIKGRLGGGFYLVRGKRIRILLPALGEKRTESAAPSAGLENKGSRLIPYENPYTSWTRKNKKRRDLKQKKKAIIAQEDETDHEFVF